MDRQSSTMSYNSHVLILAQSLLVLFTVGFISFATAAFIPHQQVRGVPSPSLSLAFSSSQRSNKFTTSNNISSLENRCRSKRLRSLTQIDAQRNTNTNTGNKQERKNRTKNKNRISVHQIVEEYNKQTSSENGGSLNKKKKYRRSRKRADSPKQTYVYATQRREMQRMGVNFVGGSTNENTDSVNSGVEGSSEEHRLQIRLTLGKDSPITIARKLGMNPSSQSCDTAFALDGDSKMVPVNQPQIVGVVRVGDGKDENQSTMNAYIIEKPAGWAIIEGNTKKAKKQAKSNNKIDGKKVNPCGGLDINTKNGAKMRSSERGTKMLKYYDQEEDKINTWEFDVGAIDLSSVMTAEELKEFEIDGGIDTFSYTGTAYSVKNNENKETLDEVDVVAVQRHSDSSTNISGPAIFLAESRPTVVTWLKELKASEGNPIRGGKTWKAIAGAVDIDDSGLVILCPKENIDNIFVDSAEYVAVVGNGKFLAPKGKQTRINEKKQFSLNDAKFETYAKVRKGRGNDVVTTIKLMISDGASTCNHAVQLCQQQFIDGIRGDAKANPLERRANRRLTHCSALTVSSLTHDELVECSSEIPDDIRLLAERRNHHEFHKGSFLGRRTLAQDEHTTAYREINGAADGWPGWIVDRYDKWLLVQHDDTFPRGPLPSLHDGYTAGVYYFTSDPDRSITGSVKGIKPTLLEGQPAPQTIEIKESGIKYIVNFDDLSTGIFLDQRHQRSWLARHCTEDTRILNCFAHCGAFSIAAAAAGAETVSLDLDKKWLSRIEPQLKANGIKDTSRHDCVYGDCKRFETFFPFFSFMKLMLNL